MSRRQLTRRCEGYEQTKAEKERRRLLTVEYNRTLKVKVTIVAQCPQILRTIKYRFFVSANISVESGVGIADVESAIINCNCKKYLAINYLFLNTSPFSTCMKTEFCIFLSTFFLAILYFPKCLCFFIVSCSVEQKDY